MKKKLLLIIFTICICFLCSNKAMALQCLYESKDGDRVALSQYHDAFNDYKALVEVLDSFEADGKTVKNDTSTFKVYNDLKGINEWKKVDTCPEKLMYNRSAGEDEVYACDSWTDCGDGDKKFYLVDPYAGPTPSNVGLNELTCTYEYIDSSGWADTYTFMIDINKDGTMHYELWKEYDFLYDNDVSLDGINQSYKIPTGSVEKSYFDSFQPRVFWNEKESSYKCADEIAVTNECDTNIYGQSFTSSCSYHIGYNEKNLSKEELENLNVNKSDGFLWSHNHQKSYLVYELAEGASTIDYETEVSDKNICAYTYPNKQCDPTISDCSPLVMLSLIERNYANGTKKIIPVINDNYIEVKNEISSSLEFDLTSCDKAPVIYTDCFKTGNYENCKISDKQFAGSEQLTTNPWSNTQDSTDVEQNMGQTNGYDYRKMLCELSDRMKVYVAPATLKTLPDLYVYSPNISNYNYKIDNLDCTEWGIITGYTCNNETCKQQISYSIEQKVSEIKDYCNGIYKSYLQSSNREGNVDQRKEECFKFDVFYDDLVAKGIINDLSIGCDFVTNELAEKLIWILDLLKIAGPIAALGLGTLDFVKAIASGDADKEMKSAFKRFTTRLIAAALLFIVPIILAFMMDTFLGNQDGYDSENPFCNIVDWTD